MRVKYRTSKAITGLRLTKHDSSIGSYEQGRGRGRVFLVCLMQAITMGQIVTVERVQWNDRPSGFRDAHGSALSA